MFRNRWGSLLFVGMTAAAAAALIGGEKDQGMLLSAADDLKQQQQAMSQTIAGETPPPVAIPTSGAVEFAPDEALIDQATGFDPTPPEERLAGESEVVAPDEVVIVSRDVGESGQQRTR